MPVDPSPGYRYSSAPKRRKKKPPPDLRRIVGSPVITPGPTPTIRDRNPVAVAARPKTPEQSVRENLRIRTILRRQRLLKKLGYYQGEIDGAWGLQAQTAWTKFVYRRRRGWAHPAGSIPAADPVPVERKEQADGVVALVRRQAAQAKANAKRVAQGEKLAEPTLKPSAARKQEELAAKKARKAKDLKARAQILGDAKALRANPQIAAKVSLRRITDVVADPETNWSARNRTDVLIVQNHLTRYDKTFKPTGVWDKETNELLKVAVEQERKQSRRKAIEATRKFFYESGILEAGTRPSWWKQPGPVPTPEKLLAILDKGDFNADKLLAEITWQAKQDRFVFPRWKNEQLQALALRTSPFTSANMTRIFGTAFGVQEWQLVNDVIGQTTPLLAAESNRDETMARRNAKNYVELRAQVKALQASGGFAEFQRRLEGFTFREEKARTDQMKAAASDDLFSWGNAFAVVVAPFETLFEGVKWAQTASIYTALSATQKVDKALHFLKRDDYQARDVMWEDAMTLMGDDPHEVVDGYDDDFRMEDVPGGALTVFTYQLTADPLNFLGPVKIASTALRKTTGAKFLGTYVKNEAGIARSFEFARRKDLVGGALLYQGKTWKVGSVLAKIDNAGGGSVFQHVPAFVAAESVVRRLAQTRIEANLRARAAVALAARQNFRPTMKMQDGKLVAQAPEYTIKDKQTIRWQQEAESELHDLFSGPDYADFVDTIVRERASLWLHPDRAGSQTSVGAALEATAYEITRTHASWDVAAGSAKRVWDREFATFREQGFDAVKARQMANAAAQEEYDSILRRIGSYFTGPDDADLLVQIQARQMAVMDDFQQTIMVQLQNYVEKRMDAEGNLLWDETGRWIGRTNAVDGDFQHQARDVIGERVRSSFSDAEGVEIANPNYGKVFTFEQMMVLAGGETRRRQQRVIRYVARETEAGTLSDAFDADKVLAGIENDVMLDWQESAPGEWIDLRRTVRESDLYLRHLADDLTPRREYKVDEAALAVLKRRLGTEGVHIDFKMVDEPVDTHGVYGFYTVRHGADGSVVSGTTAGTITVYVPSRIMVASEEGVAENLYRELTNTISHELFHAKQHFTLGHPITSRAPKTLDEEAAHINIVEGEATNFGNVMAAAFDEAGKTLYKATETPPTYGRASLERIMQMGDDPTRVQGVGSYDIALRKLLWDMGSRFRSLGLADWDVADAADDTRFAMRPKGSQADQAATEGRRKKLSQAVTKNQTYLAQATTANMAKALRGELALWMALRESEMRPAKVIAAAAQGWSDFWLFTTLALRPAWTVKNMVDNYVKVILAGLSDPRLLYMGARKPGDGVRSIFDGDVRALLAAVEFLDNLMGSDGKMIGAVKAATDRFWEMPAEVIQKVFVTHGLREVPEAVIQASRLSPFERPKVEAVAKVNIGDPKLISDPKLLKAAEKHQAGRAASHEKRVMEWEQGGREGPRPKPTAAERYESFRNHYFDLLGNKPEAFHKRMIYRSEFEKAMRQAESALGGERITLQDAMQGRFGAQITAQMQIQAHDIAWAAVEKHLFDYSKISVIEDNFRFFLPFIQFWRKNSMFWLAQAADKAWISQDILKYEEMREEVHGDLPEWMHRYWAASEVTDKLGFIPGFEGLVKHLGIEDAMYDPLNYLSFAPLYRSFKSENPNLPPDKQGNVFFGGMIDAMSEWGLGMNPLVRSTLETAGIAHERAWQFMFPQTGLAVAMSRKHFGDRWAGRVADWESLWGVLGTVPSDSLADNFNYHVQMRMAEQAARGEEPNRAEAEEFVRDWFYLQNVHGYFHGAYFRNGNPTQIHLSKLHDDIINDEREIKDLSEDDKKAWSLWNLRGADRYTFDKYTDAYPMIQAYYRMQDWDQRQQYLQDHPEINKYVDPIWTGNAFSTKYVTSAALSAGYFQIGDVIEDMDLPYGARVTARTILVTPELQAHWDKAATPEKERRRMIQAEAWQHQQKLNAQYWAIPQNDYKALAQFRESNPELIRGWNRGNDKGDDFEVLRNTANADLRAIYSSIRNENGGDNWDEANSFLRRYSFIFDGTKAEGRIDEKTGEWLPRNPERRRAYLAARAGMAKYRELKERGRAVASDWLRSDDPDAKLALAYFNKYPSKKHGKVDAHGRAYLAVKTEMEKFAALVDKIGEEKAFAWLYESREAWAVKVQEYMKEWGKYGDKTGFARDFKLIRSLLRRFLDMPAAAQKAFLANGSPEAKRLQKFMDEYLGEDGITGQGFAWLEARDALSIYGSIRDKQGTKAANEWLQGSTPEAKKALDYIKRFGQQAKIEKAFTAKFGDDPQDMVDYLRKNARTISEKQRKLDYAAANDGLARYFSIEKTRGIDAANKWLRGESVGAKVAQLYFDKWGSWAKAARAFHKTHGNKPADMLTYLNANKRDRSEAAHARDHAAAATALDTYFSLDKKNEESARSWLKQDGIEQQIVRAYFAKWSKTAQAERKLLDKYPEYKGGSPEQRRRFEFWRQYYSLTPDKRQAFVMDEAENYGVFVYGAFGEQERHDKEAEWNRRAIGVGMSKRQAAYLYVKPLLDFYYKLAPKDRVLFARLNPEVREYLDEFSTKSPTGNKKLDALVEGYFKLPSGSRQRTDWLRKHPEVQDYFDRRSTPAERALRAVLEQYFELKGDEREDFLMQHPEINEYFDQKRRDDSAANAAADVFDLTDPRLRQYFKSADDASRSAEEMRRKLRQAALNSLTPDTLETRRDGRRLATL